MDRAISASLDPHPPQEIGDGFFRDECGVRSVRRIWKTLTPQQAVGARWLVMDPGPCFEDSAPQRQALCDVKTLGRACPGLAESSEQEPSHGGKLRATWNTPGRAWPGLAESSEQEPPHG